MLCGDDRLKNCNYTIEDFIEYSPPMIFDCELHSDDKNMNDPLISSCESLLVRTLTDQGVCYTFNMFDPQEIFKDHVITSHEHHGKPSEWNLETGFALKAPRFDNNASDSIKTGPFPKRAKNAVILNIFHEIDTLPGYCATKSDGFKIILHSPHELPMVGFRESPWIPLQNDPGTIDKYIDIPAYGNILIDVRSRKIVASQHLNIYSINQRRCFFPGERQLAYFRYYSFNNCHLECLTNKTLEICKCKDFYMPTWDHDDSNTSKICTGDYSMRCIHHAFDLWDKNKQECQCYPTCTTLEYDSKTWYNVRPIENERASQRMNKTVIVVYSTDPDYIKSERRATYSLVDFIADCGGVFGLFCGMSIISILEFLYFGTLWFLEARKARRKSRGQVGLAC
ncbi:pickpocket protein 28 [Halyomorpha halys]|uniref:pickpocket protein 28 n=1 Tax=Halyomorpha halys TaxID=286706 RepID=UPI0034D1B2C5